MCGKENNFTVLEIGMLVGKHSKFGYSHPGGREKVTTTDLPLCAEQHDAPAA